MEGWGSCLIQLVCKILLNFALGIRICSKGAFLKDGGLSEGYIMKGEQIISYFALQLFFLT